MKPTVKQSEKSRILKTTDYSIFEFPDVKISKNHLDWVMESIIEKNLMPDYPILVDENYKILDGRYRFLACYELKLPVHYKMAEVTTLEDALRAKEILLKTPLSEIVKLYQGRDNYDALKFIKGYFLNYFKYETILRVIPTVLKRIKSFAPIIDRYKFVSGKLGQFDVEEVIAKLEKVKYICEEYGWDASSAIQLLTFHNYNVNFQLEDKRLRWAKAVSIKVRDSWNRCTITSLPFGIYVDQNNFYIQHYPMRANLYCKNKA